MKPVLVKIRTSEGMTKEIIYHHFTHNLVVKQGDLPVTP
jgi:hypothetical protein